MGRPKANPADSIGQQPKQKVHWKIHLEVPEKVRVAIELMKGKYGTVSLGDALLAYLEDEDAPLMEAVEDIMKIRAKVGLLHDGRRGRPPK